MARRSQGERPPKPDTGPSPPSPVLDLLQRHPHGVILACFFLSGAAGLVYEVVWSRRLTLVFGVTVLAYSTVLAAFLGGLAAGSIIFGRIADRRGDRLRLYAILEGLVGLFCLATPWLFTLVERTYVVVHPALEDQLWLLRLVRFGLAALVMFVPTAMMGGTLPLLSRARVRRLGEVGTEVGALYGTNTLGAVLGAVAAGFFLLPAVGLRGSTYLAAVLNLAVALVAFALYSTQGDQPAADPEPETTPAEGPVSRGAYVGLLLAYGASGAAALIYEVVWTRILSLAFGTSVYAFSGMLAAFLAGIALGSIVPSARRLAWVDRLKSPLVWFGLVEVLIAAAVTALTPLLDRLPFVFLALFGWIGPRFRLLELAHVAISFLIMLPAAGLMGFAFPLVTRIATERVGALGRRLSAVYAANTLGTVAGSFAAGFVLIPLIGARWALGVGVALNAAVGVAYLAAALRQQRAVPLVGFALTALVALAWLVMPSWSKEVLTAGAYVYPGFYASGDARAIMHEKEVLYYRDALTAAISVTRVDAPGRDKPVISLQINGKTDASSGDLSTQLILGDLPTLLCETPRSALGYGLASGCTLGALEAYDEYERIDCVEIEPEMVRVTGFFRELNRDCLADPRARLSINDARNYVLVTHEQYDVLTSEPSNPWIAGIGNLFTVEHFRLCREHLAPDGVFCQWVPIYNLAPEDFRCIAATFQSVFPEASLWVFPDLPSDAYLIGTLQPLEIDVPDLAVRASRPEVAADLSAAQLGDVWDILAGYVLSPDTLATLAEGATPNTDDFPRLEFSAPLRLYGGAARQTLLDVLRAGVVSIVPVAHSGEDANGRCWSPVAGLALTPPWHVRGERTFVCRNPQRYMVPGSTRRARIIHVIDAELGGGSAEIWVARPGEIVDPRGENLEPEGTPSYTAAVAGHEAAVWRPQGRTEAEVYAWTARWLCPERERVYVVRARVTPDGGAVAPEGALRALTCEAEELR